MSQYSETMGSFIRTGNYPLEANYYFETEQELFDFYSDPINKSTLHPGLFRVVGNQTLYWAVRVADFDPEHPEYEFKKYGIEGGLIENARYDADRERITIRFKIGKDKFQDVEIPVSALIEEWEVDNSGTVQLTRTRNIQGKDTLSAEVKISDRENNALVKEGNSLFVKQQDVDINFVNGNLELSINGTVVKTIAIADKVLVTPIITSQWSVLDQEGNDATALSGINVNANAIVLERGFIVNGNLKFKWVYDNTKKSPTSTSGAFGNTLPTSNVEVSLSQTNITSNKTIQQALHAPKGLAVSGTSVIAATTEDSTYANASVTFNNRIYYGVSLTNTNIDVTTLGATRLQAGKDSLLTGVTSSEGDYYWVYAYPKNLGPLTKIDQGATPVIEDFVRIEQVVKNPAKQDIPYYLYVTKNKKAFTNQILNIS